MVVPAFDKEKLQTIAARGNAADVGKAAAARNDLDGGVQTVQTMAGFVVNRFSLRYTLIWCFPPPLPQDRIRLTNNTSADNAVILTDYRTLAGCQNDLIHRTATTVGIGNALTNGACNSEVSVFSDDNAMS